MFLDNLGHGFKDAVIFFLIIFSTILSINVLTMNDSLNWWKDEVIVSNLKVSLCKREPSKSVKITIENQAILKRL